MTKILENLLNMPLESWHQHLYNNLVFYLTDFDKDKYHVEESQSSYKHKYRLVALYKPSNEIHFITLGDKSIWISEGIKHSGRRSGLVLHIDDEDYIDYLEQYHPVAHFQSLPDTVLPIAFSFDIGTSYMEDVVLAEELEKELDNPRKFERSFKDYFLFGKFRTSSKKIESALHEILENTLRLAGNQLPSGNYIVSGNADDAIFLEERFSTRQIICISNVPVNYGVNHHILVKDYPPFDAYLKYYEMYKNSIFVRETPDQDGNIYYAIKPFDITYIFQVVSKSSHAIMKETKKAMSCKDLDYASILST